MPSSRARKPNRLRRFMWLGIVWVYIAGRLEAMAAQAIAEFNRDGSRSADCANPAARGFPFGMGLNCDSVRFEDTPQKVAMSAAAFRSGVQVYSPFNVTAELGSPARVSVP